MPGAASMDMIDTSPGPDARVSIASLFVCVCVCVRVHYKNTIMPSTTGARGAVFPGAVFVPHGAGEGGGDCRWHQAWHPPGKVHFLLHLLISRRGGTGGGHEEVSIHIHNQTVVFVNKATCTHTSFKKI